MFARSRRLLKILAGSIALAASACFVASASAGEYDVWSCRGPVDQPLGMSAWDPRYNDETVIGDFWVDQDCGAGGAFEMNTNISDTGSRRPTFHMAFDLPSGATIAGYRLFRAIETAPAGGPTYDYVSAVREGRFPPFVDEGCRSSGLAPPFPCQSIGINDPSDWDDPTNEVDRSGLGLDGLSVWVGCAGASGCNPAGSLSTTALFALFQSRVTILDPDAPAIASVSGTLVGSGPVNGKANLFVQARDSISGVRAMAIEIDGQPSGTITIDSPTCVEPYEVTRPCPAEAGRIFTVDTAALAEGAHTVAGTATDAAGNQTAFGPVDFTVDRPDPPDPPEPQPENGSPAVNEPVINLGAGSVWHRPGKAASVAGRLLTDEGVPVAGAILRVRSTPLGVRTPRTVDLPDATTGADGRFQISVRGNGAREIEISFAPRADSPVTSSSVVRVRSRLLLSLKPRPRKVRIGRRVTFTGRIAGAGPSGRGVPVEIQAKVAGRWETVASVRTRAGAQWRWRYRFRYVKRRALFSFRAIVRDTPGWPWPQLTSPVRKVQITMRRR